MGSNPTSSAIRRESFFIEWGMVSPGRAQRKDEGSLAGDGSSAPARRTSLHLLESSSGWPCSTRRRAPALPAQAKLPEILANVPESLLPTDLAAEIVAMAMSEAIKPYSIATAPVSSFIKFTSTCTLDLRLFTQGQGRLPRTNRKIGYMNMTHPFFRSHRAPQPNGVSAAPSRRGAWLLSRRRRSLS